MANLNIRRTEKNHLDNWYLVNNHYYDFFLNPDATDRGEIEDCVSSTIDPDLSQINEDGTIFSVAAWEDAKNTGIELRDWGLCSVDNGATLIDWEKDDLEDIFKNTLLSIPEEEKRFYMKPIDGNFYCNPPIDYTLTYEYNNGKKVMNAQGGGLQGFYKLFLPKDVGEYQTLPIRPNKCVAYEFMIKPENIIKPNTMSHYYPDNFGIFFYQGLARENKWWYYTNKINIENLNNIKNTLIKNGECNLADLLDPDKLHQPKSVFENLINSEGISLNTPNIVELKTDNKYLFMNRTCCGYKVECCGDNSDIPDEITFSYQKKNTKLNYYTLFNRTTDEFGRNAGLTVSAIHPVSARGCCSYGFNEIWKKYQCNPILMYQLGDKPLQNLPPGFENIDIYDNTIDIYKDTYNNAMAFRITPEGAIGYRINVVNCDEDKEENPTKIIEEYSADNIIKFNEWNRIIVQICYSDYIKDVNCTAIKSRKGVISFYVNGKLKFTSNQFKEPMFHELDEHWSKQEGVPFNMSLMTGSQGLLETILSDNPEDYVRYTFPIEKRFCGNLCGLLSYFKMHNCKLPYNYIKQKVMMI
jgi:hypothetical protein